MNRLGTIVPSMTLHEMATGVLPKWGDGKTEVSLTKGEAKIVAELFVAAHQEVIQAILTAHGSELDEPGVPAVRHA